MIGVTPLQKDCLEALRGPLNGRGSVQAIAEAVNVMSLKSTDPGSVGTTLTHLSKRIPERLYYGNGLWELLGDLGEVVANRPDSRGSTKIKQPRREAGGRVEGDLLEVVHDVGHSYVLRSPDTMKTYVIPKELLK